MSLNAGQGSTSDKAERAARRAANSKSARVLARLGLSARGAVYIVMGLLTLSVARGSGEEVDQSGALREVLHQPFGTFLVILLAIAMHPTSPSNEVPRASAGLLKRAGLIVLFTNPPLSCPGVAPVPVAFTAAVRQPPVCAIGSV